MRMSFKYIAVACLLFQPALADPVTEYADAFARFYPGGSSSPQDHAVSGLQMMRYFPGIWAEGQIMFSDGALDADELASTCDRIGFEIAPAGEFTFTMTRLRQGERSNTVTTFTPIYGASFARSTDLEGFFQDTFPNRSLEEMAERGILQSTLGASSFRSPALMHLWSPNILVIEAIAEPPRILVRCP